MEGGDHVRVRVILDISKPFCRGRKITLDGGTMVWVSFKYERLPSICFWCGCLTYGEKDYEQWITGEGSLTVVDQKYGVWLRAPLSNHIKKIHHCCSKFLSTKERFKASKEEGSEQSSKPHQASLPKSNTLLNSLERVTLVSMLPNSAEYPSVRILEDLLPGFGGQPNTKNNFLYTLHESDAE